MDFENEILKSIKENIKKSIKCCPYCCGAGELKAMQSVATYKGSIRGKDVQVKCKHCNGIGLIIH